MRHLCKTGEERIGFWWGGLTENDHLVVLSLDGGSILKTIFKK
jgi:hypothetical protein